CRSQVGNLIHVDVGNLVRKCQIKVMPKLDVSMVIFHAAKLEDRSGKNVVGINAADRIATTP
ncbi:MAG: hypothetical protein OEM03_13280, partial [Chromatiales bacterium]|nr:hypothetical protein [Chromatiales bacterium]